MNTVNSVDMAPPSDIAIDLENGPDDELDDDIGSLKGSLKRQLFRGRVSSLLGVVADCNEAYTSSRGRGHQQRGQLRRSIPSQRHRSERLEDVCNIHINVALRFNLKGF
jgi:hypothetical protein